VTDAKYPTPIGVAMSDAARKIRVRPGGDQPDPEPTHDERVASVLAFAGVPKRYDLARFHNWRETPGTRKALQVAKRVAERPTNVIFVGPWGCGKTRLSASIMASRVEAWMRAYPKEIIEVSDEGMVTRPPFASRFVGVPELLDSIRRSYEYDDEVDPLRALRRAPLLILDDLGREKATDWVLERLYVLIDDRYGNHRPTIVTTNYSLDELARRDYGAMVSRLTEDGSVVKISAADQRPGTPA
jgi:DNA replication protein DnaC